MSAAADKNDINDDGLQEFDDLNPSSSAPEIGGAKKTGGLLAKIALVLVLAGAGVFYYLNSGMFMPSSAPPVAATQIAPDVNIVNEQPPAMPQPTPSAETATAATAETSPVAIPPPGETLPAPVADNSAPAMPAVAIPPVETPEQTSAPNSVTPSLPPAGATAPVEAVSAEQVAPPAPVAEATPQETEAPKPADVAVAAAAVAETAPAPAEAEAPAAEMPKQVEDVAALHAKIAELEKQVSSQQETIDRMKKDAAEAEITAPVRTSVKTSAPKKSAPVKKAPAPKWVLKSAKPGEAWVSNAATGAMQSVKVGDTIQGIGRVTAIARDSLGYWVVNGTNGRISQ